ncbi:thioredoxin family protein [Sphingobacterium sp. ML3W]|uniref:thioredoxin family protein n=1 Tax=Sphingobacterium sp. ML3W TaxID=1538644 RepID=UPI000AFC5D41|nr:thioredoxin family protein [Sphingobacterium sp. ML3W]
MKRFELIILMVLLLGSIVTAQTKSYTIEDIDSVMLVEKKPILILLSTDWCKYCQMQKKQLEKNKVFLKQTDNFYYVIFNAERKDSIVFHNESFQYKPKGLSSGIHELALALNGSENIAFPTWIMLDSNYQVVLRNSGMLRSVQIQELLEAIEKF